MKQDTPLKSSREVMSPMLLVVVGLAGLLGSYMGIKALASSSPAGQSALRLTTVSLDASSLAITYGQSVNLGATIESACGNSGIINFFDGAATSENLLGSHAVQVGGANIATASLGPGTHQISARFGGNTVCSAAASAPITVKVAKPTKAIKTTSTSLASNRSAVAVNTVVNLIANVNGACGPTGKVNFYDGAITNDKLIGTSNYFDGRAILATAALKPGAHKMLAAYDGDTSCDKSTSQALTVTVN